MHPFSFLLTGHNQLPVPALFLFLTIICFHPVAGYAENGVDELFESEQISGDIEQLQQNLDELKIRKIRINEADADELRQLPWLNSGDILAILEYRRANALFVSLQQLREIIGSRKTVQIIPYLTISDGAPSRKAQITDETVTGSFNSRILWDTTPRAGLSNGRYPGDEYKLYNRLQLDYANYGVTLVHDKDIGEPDFADFISLSIGVSDLGILKTGVLGNYKLNFGQGLLAGQSRFLSKGSEPSNSVRLSSKQLTPYASSSEYGFFQGAAATLDLKPFEVTAFYSSNLVDARNTGGPITSFDEAGYHRTTTERDRKDNVTETVYGASLLYRFASGPVTGKVGGTWLRYDYDDSLNALGGNDASSALGGFEADLAIGRLGLFGEAAWSQNPGGAMSWIAGAEYRLFSKVNLLVAVRDYAPGYYSPFAGAFAERGDNGSNEQGYYVGIDAALSKKVSVGAYYDRFRFQELSSTYPFGSSGFDTRLFIYWKQSSAVAWNLQFQHKEKDDVLKQCSDGSGSCKDKEKAYAPLPKVTDRVRLDCDIDASRKIHLRTRGEVKRVVKDFLAGDENCYGWLLYQQANFKTGKFGLKSRFTIFNTDDYDASIYVYEDDLPLVFNSTGFNGRGKAFFILGTWDITKNLKLAGKFETTWYDDRKVYGSNKDDQRNTSAPGTFHFGCSLKF